MKNDNKSGRQDPSSETGQNPSASARRRLIRALGGTSGAALAGLIAGGWKKPLVDTITLPVHADLSGPDRTSAPQPSGCAISISGSLSPTGTDVYTFGILVQPNGGSPSNVLEAITSGTTALSYAATFAAGEYYLGVHVSKPGNSETYVLGASVSCCNTTNGGPFNVQSTNTQQYSTYPFTVADEGVCTLGFPG